jgi:hypothetical protein
MLLIKGEATHMIGFRISVYRRTSLRAAAGGLLVLIGAACSSGDTATSPEAVIPADSVAAPSDTLITAPGDSAAPLPGDSTAPAPSDSTTPPADSSDTTGVIDASAVAPGIAFGSFNMQNSYLSSVHTGAVRGGDVDPTNIVAMLADAKAKGARFVIKMCRGRDSFVKNPDGTFSLTKWKALIDRYRSINLGPYIADGTLLGHYLIDEPHMAGKWGGKIISQATIEAMARYSKQIWPTMTTFVRTTPSWLAGAPITYTSLDAAWAQYAHGKGDVAKYVATEVTIAKAKRLGLIVGMNVFAGGDGSSGIRTPVYSGYVMSASEIRRNATALLNQTYACGFFMWMHDVTYYGRSDIKAAMAEMSAKARTHVRTSCKQ